MNDANSTFQIGLGVSGGIAAYKAVEVLRLLQRKGCNVQVAMTKNAAEFIQPLTFRALTDQYVLVDDYETNNPDPIAHINFSQNIDLLLIVPATANIIAKFANGIADDFLTSTYLASSAPVLIAPAMNTKMWKHASTKRNIKLLKKDGVHFAEPVWGDLACKSIGVGKLEDAENITKQVFSLLRSGDAKSIKSAKMDLSGEKFLITVGSTREAIDPIRFISNHSSGKMGFAIAEAATNRGADVTVVIGQTSVVPPNNVKVVKGISAEDMHRNVIKELPEATIFIGTAAVSDYRPKKVFKTKIKKDEKDLLTLHLEKTLDILSKVSENRHNGLLLVGFAAETNNAVGYAKAKMNSKNLDMVIVNDITKERAGFDTETNIATILTRDSKKEIGLPLMQKSELAKKILDEIAVLRKMNK